MGILCAHAGTILCKVNYSKRQQLVGVIKDNYNINKITTHSRSIHPYYKVYHVNQ